MTRQRLLAGIILSVGLSGSALALCADVNNSGGVTSTDALVILNRAVSLPAPLSCSCATCGTSETTPEAFAHCADVNADGQITASDALVALGAAVGQPVPLDCSCDACGVGTTTTTLPGCPAPGGLDGRTFNEKYTCVESLNGGNPFCADNNAGDAIQFTHIGDGSYDVRDVPDTGFVYNGQLGCTTFTWVAEAPGEYTEQGTWEFTSDLESFSGSSIYIAQDFTYNGSCNETGAESPTTPPNPQTIPPCQQGGGK